MPNITLSRWSVLLTALIVSSLVLFLGHVNANPIDVTATVPGPPPATAPIVETPTQNAKFINSVIEVSGSCEIGTIVRVFRNGTIAGMAPCDGSGHFQLSITLLVGENKITARHYDLLNQAGPLSGQIIVFYSPLVPSTGGGGLSGGGRDTFNNESAFVPPQSGSGIHVTTNYNFRIVKKGERAVFLVRPVGGVQPYSIKVDWDDGATDEITHPDDSEVELMHLYKEAGIYTITIEVEDADGNEAYLQLVVVSGGDVPDESDKVLNKNQTSDNIMLLVFITTISFVFALIIFGYMYEREVSDDELDKS